MGEVGLGDSLSAISISLVSCTNLSSQRSARLLFASRRRSLKALIRAWTSTYRFLYPLSSTVSPPYCTLRFGVRLRLSNCGHRG